MAEKYDIQQKASVEDLLRSSHEIPYNQRGFQWEYENIIDYHNDLVEGFNPGGNPGFYSLGSFMLTIVNKKNSVWDGQQRTIMTLIYLSVIMKYCTENFAESIDGFIEKIKHNLFKDSFEHSAKEKKLYENLNKETKIEIRIPKIKCVNQKDNFTLICVLNGIWESRKKYYERENSTKWKCNICGVTKKTKTEILIHLKNKCILEKYGDFIGEKYEEFSEDNSIMNAYNTTSLILNNFISDTFLSENTKVTEKRIINFANYLMETVVLDIYKYRDIKVASQMFDRLNNRGKHLKLEDINRNILIRGVRSYKSQKKYYTKYNEIIERARKIKFTKKSDGIFTLCFEMMNGKFSSDENFIRSTLEENEARDSIRGLESAIKKIEEINDYYLDSLLGEIVVGNYNWNIVRFIVVPFFKMFESRKARKNLTEIIASFLTKMISVDKTSKYTSNVKKRLRPIGEKIFDGDSTYCKILNDITKECSKICEVMDIHQASFVKKISTVPITQEKAKRILLYNMYNEQPKGIKIDHSMFDVEHIIPKKGTVKTNMVEYIGNKTLFEGGNSNKHKGNKSLQNKSFEDKRDHYLNSNIKWTQKIGKKKKWNEKMIMKYGEKLSKNIWNVSEEALNKEYHD